jgi:pimeloyl-ACP methyl ester carboxylesterase
MIRRLILALLSTPLLFHFVCAQTPTLKSVSVRGVDLAYTETGKGEPLILLHGGQADYRSWLPHLPALSERFRVIAYSRRYNYPNDNPIVGNDHSAFVEADDLAAFIEKLGLKRVHLVGTSIGAYTALIVAVKHPKLVASLVLAEPNIHAWVQDTPEFRKFMSDAWLPAAAAFRAGSDRDAMRYLVDIFGGSGTFDRMTPEAAKIAMQNSRFFKATTLSKDHSPDITREKVRRLRIPILIVSGENTFPMAKLIVKELERVLPGADRIVIPNAGHGSPRQNPAAFAEAVLNFLFTHKFGGTQVRIN